MLKDNKKKILLILILLPLFYFGLDFTVRKTKTRKHFILISIENFYVENSLEQDPFFTALKNLARENNINLSFASPKGQVPLNWKIVAETWPKKVWRKNVVPIGDPDYSIDVKNDLRDLTSKTNLVTKKIAENSQKAFFVLINYQTLNPPLFDIQISENQGDDLLKNYSDSPAKFKTKTFLLNLLFDDSKTFTGNRPSDFWYKAYDEEIKSKDAVLDAAIIKKFYSERKILIYKSLQSIIKELKTQNELQDTEILILSTLNVKMEDKSRLLDRYFSEYLKMSTFDFSISPKSKPAWKNLGHPSKLNAEFLSRLEDF